MGKGERLAFPGPKSLDLSACLLWDPEEELKSWFFTP